jgi:hypothetical protein
MAIPDLVSRVQLAACIIRYHVTQTAEKFHIVQLFLIYHNKYWGMLP